MTGKTTYIARQIEKAAEKHGPENVVVASFTKAAATELNRRKLPIPRENIGTLHALCYRAMGSPEIAEAHAADFNAEYPQYAITVTGMGKMDEMAADAVFATDGDKYLNAYNLVRARCQPLELMNRNLKNWVRKWESWKMATGYIDFTDMIGFTMQDKKPLPGSPKVGFIDEAQDLNRLEFNLVRHWAKYMEQMVISGDEDQTIYDFSGANPEAFLNPPVAPDHKRVLRQSWRLPRKVHEYSQKWIKQIKNREPKEFNPRDEEGAILNLKATYKTPNAAIELADRYARDGKTVMLLTTCGFMLNAIKSQLRAAGLPFHNEYRASRGDWNPLGSFHGKATGRVSTRERLLCFLNDMTGRVPSHYWSVEDLQKWIELIRIRGVLKKGAKERVQAVIERVQAVIEDDAGIITGTDAEFYGSIFEDFALEKALARDIPWFKEQLLAAKRTAVEYPLTVYQKQGREALEEKPRITVGTVHSVKGGESEIVILFPDLSLSAMQEYQKNKDSIIRTFYVGMTRAKETLVLCQPNSSMSVKL